MHKKLIALAVAGAIAPAMAFADTSAVTLYGTLNVDFENVKATGATAGSASDVKSRNRVTSNSSNIGVKGMEDLGGGLKAIFQVESSIGLDDGSGTLAGRNSNLGLTGDFGTVFLGNWDTPYKASTIRLDPFGAKGIAGYANIMGGGYSPTTANAANRESFDRRQKNSVQYWTPDMSGFSARVGYSANEEKTTTASPSLWSASAAYENGPIYVTTAYERHNQYDGSDSKDKAWKLGGAYTIAGLTLSAIYEDTRYEKGLVDPDKVEVKSYFLGASYAMGAHTIRASYGANNKVKVNGVDENDAKAKNYSLGYGYNLSKRTQVYALYTKIDNKPNSANDFGHLGTPASLGSAIGAADGADPTGYGVGFQHTF